MAGEGDLATLRDSKFAHLLKPIRDLADNWGIGEWRELAEHLGLRAGVVSLVGTSIF